MTTRLRWIAVLAPTRRATLRTHMATATRSAARRPRFNREPCGREDDLLRVLDVIGGHAKAPEDATHDAARLDHEADRIGLCSWARSLAAPPHAAPSGPGRGSTTCKPGAS